MSSKSPDGGIRSIVNCAGCMVGSSSGAFRGRIMRYIKKVMHYCEVCCGYHKPHDRKDKKLSEKRIRARMKREIVTDREYGGGAL